MQTTYGNGVPVQPAGKTEEVKTLNPLDVRGSFFAGHVRSLVIVSTHAADVNLVRELLRDGPGTAGLEVLSVSAVYEARAVLSLRTVGCLVLDLDLPQGDGLEAMEQLRNSAPDVPIIVLTRRDHDELAFRALSLGAQEYLVKGELDSDLLARSIRYAVERKKLERQLAFQAMHDPLTGLPNRPLFMEYVRAALARAERTRSLTAVLYVDLDRFRTINDTHGHEVGDLVIDAAARRIQEAVRPSDVVARFGGDEFAIVCDSLLIPADASVIASRISARLATTLAPVPEQVALAASVGVAVASAGDDPQLLLRHAYTALHEAKKQRGGFEIYDDELTTRSS